MKKLLFILLFFWAGTAWGQSHNYYYYLGPWVVTTEEGETVRKPPVSTVGLIDFTPPKKALANIGFFVTTQPLGAGYYLLLQGDATVDNISTKDLKKFEQLVGYRPLGNNLVDLIYDYLTNGSDVTGGQRVKPLMPTVEGYLELHLGGHSCVKREKFVYGVHSHSAKVKALLQNDYRKMREEDLSKGSNHYLKVLDFLGEKFKVNPQEFIPDDLPKETPIKHETVITESFNTADSDTLGPDLSWTETVGDVDVVSNQAKFMTLSGGSGARAGTALSSSNNYSQSVLIFLTVTNGTSVGNTCRQDTNANATVNLYYGRYLKQGDFQLYKAVNGTFSSIGTYTESLSEPITLKTSADGSTISVFGGGVSKISVTDTSISSGTYAGIRVYNASGSENPIEDSFVAGDLGAAPASTSLPMENIGGGLGRGIARGMR